MSVRDGEAMARESAPDASGTSSPNAVARMTGIRVGVHSSSTKGVFSLIDRGVGFKEGGDAGELQDVPYPMSESNKPKFPARFVAGDVRLYQRPQCHGIDRRHAGEIDDQARRRGRLHGLVKRRSRQRSDGACYGQNSNTVRAAGTACNRKTWRRHAAHSSVFPAGRATALHWLRRERWLRAAACEEGIGCLLTVYSVFCRPVPGVRVCVKQPIPAGDCLGLGGCIEWVSTSFPG